jgi:hypothetical protein
MDPQSEPSRRAGGAGIERALAAARAMKARGQSEPEEAMSVAIERLMADLAQREHPRAEARARPQPIVHIVQHKPTHA